MFLIDSLILGAGILLLLGIASSKLSNRLGVPVLVLFLILGMLAGSEGIGGVPFENYRLAHAVGTLALALILFDGGLSTPFSAVRAVWKPALLLATVGVFVTAIVTGAAASWVLNLSLMEGLLLGSIAGSTDAAAVFAVLRSGGVSLPSRLQSTLEVESGANDPMAIFMTIGCIEVLAGRMQLGPGLIGLFVSQMGLGLAIGLAIGWIAVWVVNRINLGAAGLYPVLVTAFGLLAFGLAAATGGSGFLAVYVAGIVIGNRRIVFQRGILLFHDASAWLSQIVMFVVLGLLSFPSRLWDVSGHGLLIAAVLIVLARPIAVFALAWPFNFNWQELVFISWTGLKGAVPITLATFPLMFGTPNASLIFDAVFFVVVVSALIQGWSLPYAARVLGLEVPLENRPPVTLEISSLRQVEGDIVDYTVGPLSRAAGRQIRDLALPEDVLIALIVRREQIIPPHGRTTIEVGDHVMVVLRPAVRPLVEQIFGDKNDSISELPIDMEFPLRGTTRIRELEETYGIELNAVPDDTLDSAMRKKHAGKAKAGEAICFGPLRLRVRRVAEDGSIEQVGLTFLPNEDAVRHAPQTAPPDDEDRPAPNS
jgi:cell volume regulation protein A